MSRALSLRTWTLETLFSIIKLSILKADVGNKLASAQKWDHALKG